MHKKLFILIVSLNFEEGGTVVAIITADFMKGHPEVTIHITCLVPSGGRYMRWLLMPKFLTFD